MRSQRGAYLALVSVMMVVLTAFGALALDLGRVFVLRTEMQNAADSAALAAALELRGDTGAQNRAESAARDALEYDGRFASTQELLETNIEVEFFCSIGSRFDPESTVIDNFCLGAAEPPGDPNRRLATGDSDSHYVRVNLNPADDGSTYTLPLLFLPVLNLFTNNVDSTASLNASATAGRHFFQCSFAPAMLCNPFELETPPNNVFQTAMNPGESIHLADQGSSPSWAPGNFAFLQLGDTPGAGAAGDYLADENITGCRAPIITNEPGQMTARTANAINTRFDEYANPGFGGGGAPGNWPPAPNVIDYPRDQTFRAIDGRFGNGDWDRESYFVTYHDSIGNPRPPGGPITVAAMTRWEVYQWEISSGFLPSRNPIVLYPHGDIPGYNGQAGNPPETQYDGIPDPLHENGGAYPPPQSIPERRVFDVAVVNCIAQGLTGRKTFPLFGSDGFARILITEQANGPPAREIWGEYLEWGSDESDANYHVDVQLFE